MPITVQCKGCRTKLAVRERAAGRTVKCPRCFGPIEVPAYISDLIIQRQPRSQPIFDKPDLVITEEETTVATVEDETSTTEPDSATAAETAPPPELPTTFDEESADHADSERTINAEESDVIPQPSAVESEKPLTHESLQEDAGPATENQLEVDREASETSAVEPSGGQEDELIRVEVANSQTKGSQADYRVEQAIRNLRAKLNDDTPHAIAEADSRFKEEAVAWDADPPWEAKMSAHSFFATTYAVLRHPLQTFGNLPTSANWRAVWYCLIAQTIQCVSFVGTFALLKFFSVLDSETGPALLTDVAKVSGWLLTVSLVATFATLFVIVLVGSYMIHLGLRTTGTLSGDYETTFRVVFYTSGACSTLLAVPGVGVLLALLGTFLWPIPAGYMIAGVGKAHGISVWRAILGVLLGWIYMSVLVLAAFLIFLLYAFVG